MAFCQTNTTPSGKRYLESPTSSPLHPPSKRMTTTPSPALVRMGGCIRHAYKFFLLPPTRCFSSVFFFFFFFSHHCAFRPTLSTTVPPFLQRCSPFFWPREKPLDHPYPSLSLVAGERLILISSLKSSALFEHSLVSLLSRTFFAFFPFLFFSFFFGEYLYFG